MVPGMIHFIKEYVMIRSIPIPKLLYAFGVCLVSVPSAGSLRCLTRNDHQCKELREKNYKTLMFFLEVAMSRECVLSVIL